MPFREAVRELFGPKDPRTVPWLDFCRSWAILLVLGSHVQDFGLGGLGAKIFNWGWTGVDLFFVLSGFLIAKQLWAELAVTGSIRIGRFLLKRGLRIWPLYYSAIGVIFVLDLLSHRTPKPLLVDLLCVSDYFHHQVPGGWSLSIEEQFYLILPILLFAFRKLPAKALLGIPIGWLILLPLLRYATMTAFPNAVRDDLVAHGFHTHTDGLAVGVILAWLAVYRKHWWRSGQGRLWLPLLAIAVGPLEHTLHTVTVSFSCIGIFYGGVVLLGLRAAWPNRLTMWRGWHVLSRLSYGSYLNNLVLLQLIYPYTHTYVTKHGTGLPFFLLWFVGFVILSNSVAFVTYSLVELPFLRIRERWLARERQKQPIETKPVLQEQ
jgi:peptidoglycan/LPS O-acetylase OafA/YrhL